MKTAIIVVGLALAIAVCVLLIWRQLDHRADRTAWRRLAGLQPENPQHFVPEILTGQPEAVRRFFRYAIKPGTPLLAIAEIRMSGKFGMGDKTAPDYQDMAAQQILAAPRGFVWKMRAGRGLTRISGSDSHEWTRFWLAGLLPVARFGGDEDHRRSAFGRMVAEAVFWTPAALLPGPGVRWQEIDTDTLQVTVRHEDLEQTVMLKIDDGGRPLSVSMQRWSNANPDKAFRLQPFGGYLSEFRDFGGYRLPTHVEAGNFFGTDNYFPFFIIDVQELAFPQQSG